MKTQIAAIAGFLIAVIVIVVSGTMAVAKSEYDNDLFESRKPFSDGIVLQCAGRKDHLDCNWDRYNAELNKKFEEQARAIAEGEALLRSHN